MNRIKMNEIIKTFGVFLVVAIVACGLILPQQASAALPAPSWMPGFPMLAGPQIIIMWAPLPGAVKYNIYLNGQKVSETPAMQHMLPSPSKSGDYNFQVAGVDASGAEGPKNEAKTIKIVKVEPPTSLVSRSSTDRISLRWNPGPGAVIYDVFRRKKGEGDFQMLASVTSTNYEDASSLGGGVVYEYAVKSKDSTGKASVYSQLVEGQILVVTKQATGTEGPELLLLPVQDQVPMSVDMFPFEVDVAGKIAVISGAGLILLPDINDPDEFSLEPVVETESSRKGYRGIHISDDGNFLYACQNKPPMIIVIDLAKRQVEMRIELKNPEPGELMYVDKDGNEKDMVLTTLPFDVVTDKDDFIYVTDNQNGRVMKFDEDGEYLGTLGVFDTYEDPKHPDWQVRNAGFITYTADDEIRVAGAFTVEGFTLDGERLPPFGGGGNTVGKFGSVAGIYATKDGYIFAADKKNQTIQAFARNDKGEWAFKYSVSNKEKNANAPVTGPLSLSFTDDMKRMFVVESIAQRIGILDVFWDEADKPTR